MFIVIMIFNGLVLLLHHVTSGTTRCCPLKLRGTISVELALGVTAVSYMRLINVASVRLSRNTTEWFCFVILCEFVCYSELTGDISILEESTVHFFCVN